MLTMLCACMAVLAATQESPAATDEAKAAVEAPSPAEAQPSTAGEQPSTAPGGEVEPVLERRVHGSPFAPKRSVETLRDLEPTPEALPAGQVVTDPWLGADRPAIFSPRHPGASFALGAVVGFGSGYYYAGEPNKGVFFSALDLCLIGAYLGVTLVLNDLVIEHDFRSGKSLARDERDFGRREAGLYAAAIVLGVAEGVSRLFQGFGSMHAAVRTNATLASFGLVPLAQGGGATLQFSW